MILDYGAFRLGPQMDFGWGTGSTAFTAPWIVPGDSALFFANIGVLFGAHAAIGHVVVGRDVVTGVSQLTVTFAKLSAAGANPQTATAWDPNRFSLSPQVSAVGYLHPFVGVGVSAGTDVASRRQVPGAIVFRFPLARYEGLR